MILTKTPYKETKSRKWTLNTARTIYSRHKEDPSDYKNSVRLGKIT